MTAAMKGAAQIGREKPGREGVLQRLQRAWGESPFYQAQLNGPAPDRFAFTPDDPRTPDTNLGQMIAKGKLSIGAQTIDCEGELERIWALASSEPAVDGFLQSFSWLRHMAALGEEGREPMMTLLRGWLDLYGKWSPEAWAPYPTSERLTQLCCYGGLLLKEGDALWRSRLLTTMARQTRHLERCAHRAETNYERLMTAMGLTLAGFCLPGCLGPAECGLEQLRRELRLQMRPDGGHISRNPSHQLSIVIRLQMIMMAMEAVGVAAPGFLKHVNARAVSFLHLFRCGDGKLAPFNGGYEDDAKAVLRALDGLDKGAAPTGFARYSGFQRLEAARLRLIVDTGVTQQKSASKQGRTSARYHGAGAFQLSSGRTRIVVNCGAGEHLSEEWTRALREADAHSCLSAVSDSNGVRILQGGTVTHRRAEDAVGQMLEIKRVLERQNARVSYDRRLYVNRGGDDLRGQDVIVGAAPEMVYDLVLRFHLHPSVKASLARDGRSVLLAASNGEGWRFRSNCRQVELEKSVYCGEGGAPQSTEQIVVRPSDLELTQDGDILLKWAFRRMSGS